MRAQSVNKTVLTSEMITANRKCVVMVDEFRGGKKGGCEEEGGGGSEK